MRKIAVVVIAALLAACSGDPIGVPTKPQATSTGTACAGTLKQVVFQPLPGETAPAPFWICLRAK